MKNLFLIALLITSISFFSCQSRSGHRISQKEMQTEIAKRDSIENAQKAEQAFKESLIVEGSMWLEGTEGETSPVIHFGISANSDHYLILTLIESRNLTDAPNGAIPLKLALKVKEIMNEFLEGNRDWRFNKEENGRVTFGFATNKDVINPLDTSMYLLDVLSEKTGWTIKVSDWGTV